MSGQAHGEFLPPAASAPTPEERDEQRRLQRALAFQDRMRIPMFVLSLVMVGLVSIHIAAHPDPHWSRRVRLAEWIIWELFVVEYLINLALTPRKRQFVKDNWIITLALVLPVLRILSQFKMVGALPGAPAYEVIAVASRGMQKLGFVLAGRQLLYALACIVMIIFATAAGEYLVEYDAPGATIRTYSDCVWWAAGTITTVGSELYPVTVEGRIIGSLTMLAGVSLVGYMAASMASLFIRTDGRQEEKKAEHHLPAEVAALRADMQKIDQRLEELTALLKERGGGGEHGT